MMTYFKVTHKLNTIAGGFRISGRICSQCSVLDPLDGELTVEASGVPIQSIDIHLLRVESILIGDKVATETTSIQTTQACNLLLFLETSESVLIHLIYFLVRILH